MSRLTKHLAPLKEDSSIVVADISRKYDDVEENIMKISDVLKEISESRLLGQKTKESLKNLLLEDEKSRGNFRRDLRNKRRRERKKKHLSVVTKKSLSDVVTDVQEKRILTPEELAQEMSSSKLAHDSTLGVGLSFMEREAISKRIIHFDRIIQNYRGYYGNNPLKWTPNERITVSNIYEHLSKEYDKLGYEEGRDKYSMIAQNLRDNPLNKLKRFAAPSAPRGCTRASGPKTFVKWADGD